MTRYFVGGCVLLICIHGVHADESAADRARGLGFLLLSDAGAALFVIAQKPCQPDSRTRAHSSPK